jgi:hypothetical protein
MVKAPSTSMAPWLASSVADTTSVPPVMAMVPLTSTPSLVVSITYVPPLSSRNLVPLSPSAGPPKPLPSMAETVSDARSSTGAVVPAWPPGRPPAGGAPAGRPPPAAVPCAVAVSASTPPEALMPSSVETTETAPPDRFM